MDGRTIVSIANVLRARRDPTNVEMFEMGDHLWRC